MQFFHNLRACFHQNRLMKANRRPVVTVVLATGTVVLLILLSTLLNTYFSKPSALLNDTLANGNPPLENWPASGPGSYKTETEVWMNVLTAFDDSQLPDTEKSLRYKNMSVAATILSATSESRAIRRYWSARAIEYGQSSLQILKTGHRAFNRKPMQAERDFCDEINTRILIAMALNYYQNGEVTRNDITEQFKQISLSYLLRKEYGSNKFLRGLERDGIIQLPGFPGLKNT